MTRRPAPPTPTTELRETLGVRCRRWLEHCRDRRRALGGGGGVAAGFACSSARVPGRRRRRLLGHRHVRRIERGLGLGHATSRGTRGWWPWGRMRPRRHPDRRGRRQRGANLLEVAQHVSHALVPLLAILLDRAVHDGADQLRRQSWPEARRAVPAAPAAPCTSSRRTSRPRTPCGRSAARRGARRRRTCRRGDRSARRAPARAPCSSSCPRRCCCA